MQGVQSLLLLSLLLGGSFQAQVSHGFKATQQEQTTFNLEGKIERPVVIPRDVLRVLQNDKYNHVCLKEGESIRGIPASWFTASQVHLNPDKLVDLIVTASNSCLYGANVQPFWVFRKTKSGHKLILSVSALGLEVLNTKTNGYRNIRISSATANELFAALYHYNGQKYRPRHTSRRPL